MRRGQSGVPFCLDVNVKAFKSQVTESTNGEMCTIATVLQIEKVSSSLFEFQNYKNKEFATHVVYADLETFPVPVDTCHSDKILQLLSTKDIW